MFYYYSDFVETKETKEKSKIVSVACVLYVYFYWPDIVPLTSLRNKKPLKCKLILIIEKLT